jgi:hypothetical protein
MIYVSMLITYCVLETSPRGTEPRYKLLLPTFLIAVTAFITVAYMIGKNPIFHQVAYGIIQTASTVRVIYLLDWSVDVPYGFPHMELGQYLLFADSRDEE